MSDDGVRVVGWGPFRMPGERKRWERAMQKAEQARRTAEIMDMRKPGEAFCSDCPDHEGCMSGYPCSLVKRVNRRSES